MSLEIRTAEELNAVIRRGQAAAYIAQEETAQAAEISALAEQIAHRRATLKWVWIAGPSSAGKTTFTRRLAAALARHAVSTHVISLDNYFVNRALTPRDAQTGQYDYEHIEAIDLPLLERHLDELGRGRPIEMPHFKFMHGRREFRGELIRMDAGALALIEGIHGLNPRITAFVDPRQAIKLYVGARTTLMLDDATRISTTNHRLLRRMIRDHHFRGNPVEKTFAIWPSVRAGEDKWIFPFQPLADVEFNTSMGYEMAVLKPFAEPLIRCLPPTHPAYEKGRELLAFLARFEAIDRGLVPADSILQEFIETPARSR